MGIEIIASIVTAGLVYFSKQIVAIIGYWLHKKESREIIIQLKGEKYKAKDLNLELDSLILRLKELEASNEIKIESVDREKFKVIINQLGEATNNLNFLLSKFNQDEIKATETIAKDLEKIEDKKIEEEWNDNKLDTIIKKLEVSNLTEDEKNTLKKELYRSDTSTKTKLKLIIPLLFIKYEYEIVLDKKNLPQTWKEWKKMFYKTK